MTSQLQPISQFSRQWDALTCFTGQERQETLSTILPDVKYVRENKIVGRSLREIHNLYRFLRVDGARFRCILLQICLVLVNDIMRSLRLRTGLLREFILSHAIILTQRLTLPAFSLTIFLECMDSPIVLSPTETVNVLQDSENLSCTD